MPAGSLLTLLDDIATLLDDVSVMTKVAAKQTAGVLGDDLALNAKAVSGVSAQRELPVVWAVFKGSLRNKLILVPAALLISAVAPWGVTLLLMIGGAYLCYEGAEKLAHRFLPHGDDAAARASLRSAAAAGDLVTHEREKIAGAVRTDFVLSAEIIAISLGTVANSPFLDRVIVLAAIALVMTIGVYGFVAAIVKLDDLGFWLSGRGPFAQAIGRAVLVSAPWLMKALSVAGTVAMFLVGGGILVHGVGPLGHGVTSVADRLGELPAVGALLEGLAPALINAAVGLLAGLLLVAIAFGIRRARD